MGWEHENNVYYFVGSFLLFFKPCVYFSLCEFFYVACSLDAVLSFCDLAYLFV